MMRPEGVVNIAQHRDGHLYVVALKPQSLQLVSSTVQKMYNFLGKH